MLKFLFLPVIPIWRRNFHASGRVVGQPPAEHRQEVKVLCCPQFCMEEDGHGAEPKSHPQAREGGITKGTSLP